jgi:type VI protein secretion system component Hcp
MMIRLVAAMGILAGTVLAQDTLTLQISGFPNCSVQAWSFGATGGSAVTTGTTGASKTKVSNLVMTRLLDNCSVNLFKAAVTQAALPSVTLNQMGPGGKLTFFTLTLDDVVVSNYQLNGAASNSQPSESVAFSFAEIKIETTAQQPDGSAGTSIQFSWDVLTNSSN